MDEDLTALTSQLDQIDAARNAVARSTASYYRTLVEGGVPDGLAATLTQSWHDEHWRSFYGNLSEPSE